MKKLFIPFAAVALMAVSCAKDYACTCTSDGTSTTGATYKKVTKKWMKNQGCVSSTYTTNNVTWTEECVIEKK